MVSVRFFGVRGSTPCSCPSMERYGGNTACVVLQHGDEDPIIFDLGTGLRLFGSGWDGGTFHGTALVTHLHWDHVQGLPFFAPVNKPGATFDVYGPSHEGRSMAESFGEFMRPPYFPIQVEHLVGDISFHDVLDDMLTIGTAEVMVRPVPHVGATNGYRVNWDGASVAYISDHQEPVGRPTDIAASVLELCDDVDLLIHDAQYTPEEFSERGDWGHCTIRYALEVAHQAGAKRLALFHHDPNHSDDDLDRLHQEAVAIADDLGIGEVLCAHEGLVVEL